MTGAREHRATPVRAGDGLLMRRIALTGVLIVAIAGCGGQARTVTVVGSGPGTTAAPSSTPAASPAGWPVTARVKPSVTPVFCSGPNADSFVGTGFRVGHGVVTASHVVAACPRGTTISLGLGTAATVSTDPTHDLARLTYEAYPNPNADPDPTPLRLETKPAYVGQPLALLGVPDLPLLGNPFKREATIVTGHVVATHRTQVLTSDEGPRETLSDAILVAVPGIMHGESGGPAVNSAGKVVGVIEGSAPGIATLTPVRYITSVR
jgi:S1-C subfamily serine protease